MSARLAIAVLLSVCAFPASAPAQTVRVERNASSVAVLGGTGQATWRIQYGTLLNAVWEARVLVVSPDRAYFAHGPWLRLIDTTRGIVVGRWRFASDIKEIMAGSGGPLISVRVKLPPWARKDSEVFQFDPEVGNAPTWELGALLSYRAAEVEAWQLVKNITSERDPWAATIKSAAAAVPIFEDLVRRDPNAPWLRVALGKLLRDAGDPRAGRAFADVLRAQSNDFTEWFRIAAMLEYMPIPERELASAAYDRAYTDFLARDRDPRLMDNLIARMILYSPYGPKPDAVPDADRRRHLERMYQLAPVVEGSEIAWAQYASSLNARGDTEAARIWRERAAIARRESLHLGNLDIQLTYDRLLLLALGSVLAALLLSATLYLKYRPQSQLAMMSATRQRRVMSMRFLNSDYWSRRERATFLVIAVTGWIAVGLSLPYHRVVEKAVSQHIRVGEIGGPDEVEFLLRTVPESPERDLLAAIADHTTGELADAERGYRALSQFAVSWNNLGVILARTGRAEEAHRAFAHALQIEPRLAEATLNTGGAPQDLATEMHRKYVPGTPMIAVPGREHFLRAYLGREWTGRYWRSLMGPVTAFPPYRPDMDIGGSQVRTTVTGLLVGVFLALSLALWTVVPFRDVTLPPGRPARMLEFVLPGVSHSWRWAGGPVLLAFSVLVLALVLDWAVGTPYMLARLLNLGFSRAFGLPSAAINDVNPSITAIAVTLGALYLANWVLIRRDRTRQGYHF